MKKLSKNYHQIGPLNKFSDSKVLEYLSAKQTMG